MSTKKKYGTDQLLEVFKRPSFGELLEARRVGEGLTQREMARILKITPSSLCDLEKGRRLPTLNRAARIAQLLGLNELVYMEAALQDQLDQVKPNCEVTIREKVG
jgi:transcriptional regulator with XRE-family HTH domain